MIHDCGSFTAEYHCTQKPVLYLDKGGESLNYLNRFGEIAHDASYHGKSEEDIEAFIKGLIKGTLTQSSKAKDFYNEYLGFEHEQAPSHLIEQELMSLLTKG